MAVKYRRSSMARELNEKQQKFLEVLFEEAGGDVVAAKKLAGYSENTATTAIVKGLKEEILEATQMYMARNAPKAAMAMTGALYDPTELGIRDKMSAAKELLDRTGLIKTEKVQVEAAGGVMLMPAKAPVVTMTRTAGRWKFHSQQTLKKKTNGYRYHALHVLYHLVTSKTKKTPTFLTPFQLSWICLKKPERIQINTAIVR